MLSKKIPFSLQLVIKSWNTMVTSLSQLKATKNVVWAFMESVSGYAHFTVVFPVQIVLQSNLPRMQYMKVLLF